MKYLCAIFLSLCLIAPVLAEPASFFVKKAKAFDAAAAKAASWDDLHSELSASSIKKLKALAPEKRARAFKFMKMGAAMGMSTPMKVKESKIGSKQASVTLASEPQVSKGKSGGTSTMTMSTTVDYVKEGGKWKRDIGPQLDKMR